MIKKVTDINSLSGVLSPLLPLICGDFIYPYNDTDGAYIQLDENEDITAVLSLKNGSATVVKTNSSVDLKEIITFFSFSCVTSFISDFSLQLSNEKTYKLLMCTPDKIEESDTHTLSVESGISEYKSIYGLLSRNAENFGNWYPVFSKKINNGFAKAVYKNVGGVSVSTATATAIYNDVAIISGVYTSLDFRNKGYACECVKGLLKQLYISEVKKTYLWCENKNISFYKKLGFTICGEVYCGDEI